MINYSFWNLINEHRIEIPIIQRDYAQGRDTQKAKEVRTSFVKSIISATKDTTSNLHLNFVYGKIRGRKDIKKIEENKKAIVSMLKAVKGYSKSLELDFDYTWDEGSVDNGEINATSFIPLDGQQRLTTLFLFHWYILKIINVEDDILHKLLNFSYHIRPSTKQFCRELILQKLKIKKKQTISSVVEDSSWFFKYWLKDPSVKGMLVTLDEIHQQCKDFAQEEYLTIWQNLSKGNNVTFELLDLDEFELTDELYVKMNARGKALTSFENFKSWVMEFIEQEDINIGITDWKHLFDASWADLFWDNKDDENMLIDEEYYIYFRNMMQLHYVLTHSVDSKTDEGKVNRDISANLAPTRKKKGKSNYYYEYTTIPTIYLRQYDVLTEDNLNESFRLIDIISKYMADDNKDIYNLIKPIFSSFVTGNITMPDKVMFYGLGQYLLEHNQKITVSDLEVFLRVLRNLVNNTEIDDISTIKSMIKGFRKDAVNYKYLDNFLTDTISFAGFRTDQVAEEKLKMGLLLKEDPEWNNLIYEAEAHKYFQGQIGFLLHLAGVDTYVEEHGDFDFTTEENNGFKETFKAYFTSSKTVFKDMHIDKSTNKKRDRALLTYGDYLIKLGNYRLFPTTDKNRDNSWYRFMREFKSDSKYNRIWLALRSLLDDFKSGKSYEDILINIPSDWRECFVKYPETLDRCGKYQVFSIYDGNYYLLSKSNRRSDYVELQTFHLWKSKFESNNTNYAPFGNIEYRMGNTKNGIPYIYFDKCEIGNKNIQLHIYHSENKEFPWEVNIVEVDGKISKIRKHLDDLLIAINNFNFISKSEEYTASLYKLELKGDLLSIDKKIIEICLGLNKVVKGNQF